jgi:hypothetical protein
MFYSFFIKKYTHWHIGVDRWAIEFSLFQYYLKKDVSLFYDGLKKDYPIKLLYLMLPHLHTLIESKFGNEMAVDEYETI